MVFGRRKLSILSYYNKAELFGCLPLNPLISVDVFEDTLSQPLVADEFRGQRFEGLIISRRRQYMARCVLSTVNIERKFRGVIAVHNRSYTMCLRMICARSCPMTPVSTLKEICVCATTKSRKKYTRKRGE